MRTAEWWHRIGASGVMATVAAIVGACAFAASPVDGSATPLRPAQAMPAARAPDSPAPAAAPVAQSEGNSLIARYGLRLADEPVSKRPGWRPPQRIVIDAGLPGLDEVLRGVAPGVTLIKAGNAAEIAAALPGADAVIGRTPFICSETVLAAGRDLRWLQTVAAGVDSCLTRPAVLEGRYLLTNMRAIAAPMIAEHTIGMLLALTRGLTVSLPRQASGHWATDYPGVPLVSLQGKTMLVVGLGGIGGEIARRANALGMRVIATRGSSRERPPFVDYVGLSDELPTLLARADVVVNAAPLTPATRDLFNARTFALMRPSSYFLNVGRGGSVVQADLVAALQSRHLAGAGLDVTDPEPLPADHPLWRAPNIVITPHMSSEADIGVDGQMRVLRENLRRYAAGERMLSVVDVKRGY